MLMQKNTEISEGVLNVAAKNRIYRRHAYAIWASLRENLSAGFPTKQDSNQSNQLQRLARKLKFCL